MSNTRLDTAGTPTPAGSIRQRQRDPAPTPPRLVAALRRPPTQGAARGSAATDIRIASAICCAIASWIATEMRWQTKGIHVRVDHVSSSYAALVVWEETT